MSIPSTQPIEMIQVLEPIAALANAAGDEIAEVERSPVVPGTLGSAEIAEFLEGLADSLPTAAARWLESYLPNVRNVFSFQHLFGSRTELGSETLGCLRGLLWARGRAIFQADGEGFSNEDGYHILWDFSDDVRGEWNMAVLEGAVWIPFRMDLGSKVHREAFLAGRVPQGASLL